MRRRRILVAMALVAVAADDGAYRVRLPVRVSADGAQRLAVPAAVLAAAQTTDLADLRILDADGRAMPIARVAADRAGLRTTALKAMPILGAADALKVNAVSLALDGEGRARVAQVNGTPVDGRGSTMLGVLLDARAVAGEAKKVALDVVVPEGQPVAFAVDAGDDLATWRRLGERTVYRAPGGAAVDATVALGMASLRRDYLRVIWRSPSRLLSPVTIRGAVLTSRPAAASVLTSAEATVPALHNAHVVDLAVPFATPVEALRVTPAGSDVVVPVRILGRDTDEQPWTPIARGLATRAGPSDIELDGASFRMLRIEADARTAGFTAAPGLRFGFAAQDVMFVAAGRPPYTLAAGKAGVSNTYLPADDLVRASGGRVSAASVESGSTVVHLADPGTPDIRRKALLWGVLIGATALLALMIWVLWRRGVSTAPTAPLS